MSHDIDIRLEHVQADVLDQQRNENDECQCACGGSKDSEELVCEECK